MCFSYLHEMETTRCELWRACGDRHPQSVHSHIHNSALAVPFAVQSRLDTPVVRDVLVPFLIPARIVHVVFVRAASQGIAAQNLHPSMHTHVREDMLLLHHANLVQAAHVTYLSLINHRAMVSEDRVPLLKAWHDTSQSRRKCQTHNKLSAGVTPAASAKVGRLFGAGVSTVNVITCKHKQNSQNGK